MKDNRIPWSEGITETQNTRRASSRDIYGCVFAEDVPGQINLNGRFFSEFCVNAITAYNNAKSFLRSVASSPALDYRITGNRMSVKGAEGAAQPFTLDGQAVFCYSSLFRHPVDIVHVQLGVDDSPVLPTAGPFLRDIQHGQIQHFQQTVIRGKNSLGLGHLAKLTVEALDCVRAIPYNSL